MDSVSDNRKVDPDRLADLFDREKALILDSIDDPVLFHDLDMKIIWANRSAENSANSLPGGLVGSRCWEIWRGLKAPCTGCPGAIALKTGHAHAAEIRSLDGRAWHIRSFPLKNTDGTIKGIVEICQDVTERRQAEDALTKSMAIVSRSQEIAHLGTWSLDFEKEKFGISSEIYRIYGYKPGSIEPTISFLLSRAHPDDLEKIKEYTEALRHEGRLGRIDHRTIWPDGSVHHIFTITDKVIRDQSGRVARAYGISQDITERKLTEEALWESKERFKAIFDRAAVGISIVDTEGYFVDSNPAYQEMLGYTREELRDKRIYDITHPEDVTKSLNFERQMKEGSIDEYHLEKRYVRKDGRIIWSKLIVSAIRNPDGTLKYNLGVVEEISGRRQAEEALKAAKAQAELYLDLMGHDINNMHQIALGYLEMARDMPSDTPRQEFLDTPIEVLQRSTQLIKNVRKLQKLHDGVFQTELVDMAAVLSDVRREFGGMPRKSIALNLNGYEECRVRANELLHDVFANLVSNAIKHTGDRADIVIDLDTAEVNGDLYYRVMVSDNGPGIPEDFKGQIFNRMLKGSAKAKGMGLGLFLVRSLVDSYHGKIWVEDRVPGDHSLGARFVVLLPAAG